MTDDKQSEPVAPRDGLNVLQTYRLYNSKYVYSIYFEIMMTTPECHYQPYPFERQDGVNEFGVTVAIVRGALSTVRTRKYSDSDTWPAVGEPATDNIQTLRWLFGKQSHYCK